MQVSESFSHYMPAPAVLARLQQADFIAVVGPTAAGKDTLITAMAARSPAVHRIVGDTSRPPRTGEHDGTDMHFRSRQAMEGIMARGAYAQVALHPSGDMYATAGVEYAIDKVSLMPILASAVPVFRTLPFKRLRILYVLPPDYDAWTARIALHAFTPQQRRKRLDEARESLAFALRTPDVLFVVSDDLDSAATRALRLVCANAIRADEQSTARDIACALLEKLIK